MASWIWRYCELKPARYCCWVVIRVKIRTQCGNLGCVFLIWILLPPTPLLNKDVFWKACVWLPQCLGIRTKCIGFGGYHSARRRGPRAKKVQKYLFTLNYGNNAIKVKTSSVLGSKDIRCGCMWAPRIAASPHVWEFCLFGVFLFIITIWLVFYILAHFLSIDLHTHPFGKQGSCCRIHSHHRLIIPTTAVPRVGWSLCSSLWTNT